MPRADSDPNQNPMDTTAQAADAATIVENDSVLQQLRKLQSLLHRADQRYRALCAEIDAERLKLQAEAMAHRTAKRPIPYSVQDALNRLDERETDLLDRYAAFMETTDGQFHACLQLAQQGER